MPEPSFIHLRVHSAYSLSHGAIKVAQLPKLCAKYAMPAIGITDLNNLFGAMDIANVCANAGIQHIVGTQITLRVAVPEGRAITAPILLLVQSSEGYRNLIKLSTASYRHPRLSAEGPLIPLECLLEHQAGLLCLMGGDQGPLGKLLLSKNTAAANAFLQTLESAFQGRLYMELMRHGTQEQKQLEPLFLELALQHNLPIVATNDVFFADPSMFDAQDALVCIAEGAYLIEEKRSHASPHKYFKSPAEMAELFADLPEAIENTVQIAQRCHFVIEEHKPMLPPFRTESGLSERDEVEKQAVAGLEKRLLAQVFPLHPPEEHEALHQRYTTRLRTELDVINAMGFPGYFLIVSDFIKWAKRQRIPVGPGRGSGAGSLVAWALTITDIDPMRFDLIFERFLNPERVSMPDFDVDFCQDRRGEVIEYVQERYGREKVAQIITFGKLQARAVLRDVGRVLSIPYPVVDRVCQMIPNTPGSAVTLDEAVRADTRLQELIRSDEIIAKLVELARQLEGLYRHASTHAAGIVIGGQDLSDIVPLYYDGESPLAITQINMKYIEKTGLLKFDFLGLKTLTVIENCCNFIRARGISIDISLISLEDAKTFELLCSVNVLGVFQLESGGMQEVLKRLQPDRFEDLVALVALYRPGPMDDIPKYLARKHGEEAVTYLHPKLQPILEKTYGVMVYQEQVMQIAQVLGGYTLGGADLLRRAMGKKNKEEMNRQRAIFIQGAIKNGVEKDVAEQVFSLMAKFASYGFNKSHSAPYALVSYQTAYLKANFPLEFFAATITYEKNNTDKMVSYFQDLKNNGFNLLPPDINDSDVQFVPENGALRYALAAVKNVGEHAVQMLVAERKHHGRFASLEDFFSRVDPAALNKRLLESLIAAGAFDSLHANRKQLSISVDMLLAYATGCWHDKISAQRSLFGEKKGTPLPLRLAPCKGDWNALERAQKEKDALGFYMNSHPLEIYAGALADLDLQDRSTFQLGPAQSSATLRVAAIVQSKDERSSKSGQKFAFIAFSDTAGTFEIPFFSENYLKVREVVEPGMAVVVEIMARRTDEGGLRLTGVDLTPLEQLLQQHPLELAVNADFDFAALKTILLGSEAAPGAQIVLHTHVSGAPVRITLPSTYSISAELRAQIFALPDVEAYPTN